MAASDQISSWPPNATPHGAMYISASAATTINPADAYVKTAGTTAAGDLGGFTMPSDNRLAFGRVGLWTIHFVASVSCSSDQNQTLSRWRLALNGTTEANSQINRFLRTGSDEGALAVHWVFDMEAGDFVEMWCTEDKAGDLTADHMTISAVAVHRHR